MDAATNAVIGPWGQWGIVGSVVIGLAIVVVMLWRTLDKRTEANMAAAAMAAASAMAAAERCHAQTLDITIKQIDSGNRMATALEKNSEVMEAAMDALKRQ